MFTVYGIHINGLEEGHTECETLDDVFMHLREMMISENADPASGGGPIFRAYGFRKQPVFMPRSEERFSRGLVVHSIGPRLQISEQQRAAMIESAMQSRSRVRGSRRKPRRTGKLGLFNRTERPRG